MTTAGFAKTALALWTACLLFQVSFAEVFLGSFVTRQHLVAGDVYLLSDRILEIRNFVYDGQGPNAIFWIDASATPSDGGRVAADGFPSAGCHTSAENDARLPRAEGVTQRVELPDGTSIGDYLGGSLSVWCDRFSANFGEVVIPDWVEIPTDGPLLECFSNEVMSPGVFVGEFTTRNHLVAGEVWLLSDRILEIRNFFYDGQGPNAIFWIDSSPVPSDGGLVAADGSPAGGCHTSADMGARLQSAEGTTQRVELPDGYTIADFFGGSLSVWCAQFSANFGEVVIPDSLEIPTMGPELECFSNVVTSDPVFLSSFTTRSHLVAGELWLLSDRVLEVRNFVYDGLGPAAFFWIDMSATPSAGGRVAADAPPRGGCTTDPDGTPLPAFTGETQRIELPDGTSITDFLGGSLSVWCEQFNVNFGEAAIPSSVEVPEVGPPLECFRSPPRNPPIFLSSFVTRAHQVAGDLYLVSDRVLQIRNYVYDGTGPAAFFWIDRSAVPTSAGTVVSDGHPSLGCAMDPTDTPLPRADGITQYIELPPGMSIRDYAGGSVSVWCELAGANFGEAVIPENIPFPPNDDVLNCFADDMEVAPIAVTPDGFNCEPLSDQYQVRWQIAGDNLNVELLGRIGEATYMGFGISGRPQTETWMIGADAVVADISESGPRVRDIFMDNRAQCNGEAGVCPDTEGGFANDVSDVSSEEDFGLTLVRYKRPLVPSDIGQTSARGESIDKSIPTESGVETYIVWAMGPISNVGNPLFHSIDYARRDGNSVSLDFARPVQDNCPPLAFAGGTEAPTATPPPPFHRPLVGDSDGSTTFDLHIGPSGGPRGYTAITGEASWGIAWYVNGILIPKLVLRRGTTYTFRVNGGNDPSDDANHHPFYLTDSRVGGYLQLTPEERLDETPIAGIEITNANSTGVFGFESPLVAPICRYETTSSTVDAELLSFEEYFDTLDTSCTRDENIVGQAAILDFTPDASTNDIIYYHCVTHFNLGFEIQVIDEDAPVVTLAPTSAPGSIPDTSEGFQSVALSGQLQGATLNYRVNLADPAAGGVDTMTVVLEAPTVGWVGFAFNNNGGRMLGSEAVIGLPDTGVVQKYNLNQQVVTGVVPMPESRQTLIDASIVQTDSTTTLSFTKILVEEGEIPVDPTGTNTFLSAWGSSNQLAFHAAREPYELDLAAGGIGTLDNPRNEAMWKAHGFLAAFAWAALTPMAITASMIRKCFPEGLWFQIHRAFNALSVTLTIVAVAIAIAALSQETPDGFDAGHFDPSFANGHRLIGLIILILAILQVTGGLLRPHLPQKPDEEAPGNPPPEKSTARKVWEVGHRLFGLGIVGLCWYQVQLGIMTYHTIWGIEEKEPAALTAFWVIVACISLVAIIGFLTTFNK